MRGWEEKWRLKLTSVEVEVEAELGNYNNEIARDYGKNLENAAQRSVVRSLCKEWGHLYFLGHIFFSFISHLSSLK